MGVRYVGAEVQRMEDPRLITGHGRYVDDITLEGMLHAAFLRSPVAHARIGSIDTSRAAELEGVHRVLTLADFPAELQKPMAQLYPAPPIEHNKTQYPLAHDEVCHVGQAIACVVADSRAIAEDALALIDVDYENLPAVVDVRTALDADAPKAHADLDTNLMGRLGSKFGDIEEAFAKADHVFSASFMQHRGGCHSMETRGVVSRDDPWGDGLTLWTSAQSPYLIRRALAAWLGEPEERVRVIAPDVGGGFGPKAGFYPEEIVIPLAARMLGRPVKWIEDRREHFVSTTTQRDQHWELEVACTSDGRMLGLRGNVTHENGAWVPYGVLLPFTSLVPLPGAYAIPAVDVGLDMVFTNTVPNSPVRGAGRPNGIYAVERMVETIARELDIPPAEVRRRNYVRADQMPYATGALLRDGSPATYDSGDYEGLLDKVLELSDFAGFDERRAKAREEGRYLGIGISSCIEDTGVGPYEGTTVRVEPSGKVLVQTGAASQGQGHHTMIALIVAENLGVAPEDILFESADTGKFPHGIGTIGSRVAVNVAPSALDAATKVREKALKLAAELLEAAEADLDIENGIVSVNGAPDISIPLGDLAVKLAPMSGVKVPEGFDPSLEATSYEGSKGAPIASGANVAEVEVDIGTGEVRVLRYSVAHDCGVMINPLIVKGQIEGGVIHGIGNALFERMIFDDQGQPMNTNYGEYLLPLASEMPRVDIVHQESPSPLNPLGVKGAGEGGTIPAAAAVVAAIENALSDFGVVIDDYPVEPQYLCELIDRGMAQAAE
ncbi:MAG: xanthine dehydrogenase family protein molybdopterin-binding subunit [Alphaproteobacteria bacterium]|nr:xanthine dehydrogenase family protein molybdopterin-binding subunit [Alphaproteobacteria bacterium]